MPAALAASIFHFDEISIPKFNDTEKKKDYGENIVRRIKRKDTNEQKRV